jgi:hypothetical protein
MERDWHPSGIRRQCIAARELASFAAATLDHAGVPDAEALHPGEPEARSEARARLAGIALPAETLADLEQIERVSAIAAPVTHSHG